jgi:cytochrome c oxidase subunit 4
MSGDKKHASVQLYWVFCVVLMFITFIEWLVFHQKDAWAIPANVMIISLLAMSLIKFVMVVGWYMHLRYDHNWLKFIFVASLLMGSGTAVALCVLM